MLCRLTGFTNDLGFRVFTFERLSIEHEDVRTEYTVRADLALVLKYGIPLQELPLLCRGVLEGIAQDGRQDFTYTEADMIAHAQASAGAVPVQNDKRPRQEKPEAQPKPPMLEPKRVNPTRWGRWSRTAGYR